MLRARMSAAFKHVYETGEVGINVVMRRFKRMAHARLRGEVDHLLETVLGKQRRNAGTVIEIELAEAKRVVTGERGKTGAFERRVVIGIQIVDAENAASRGRKLSRDMKPYETGGAGHQDRDFHLMVPLWSSQSVADAPSG